jgi:hypothetical protein
MGGHSLTTDALRTGSAGTAEVLLAALLGIALVWLLVSLSLPLRYSYQNDSSGYADGARMLLQGKGIRGVAPWDDTDHEYAPTPLFPPGFAVQTALVSLAGPDPAQAARLGSWIAWALLAPGYTVHYRALNRPSARNGGGPAVDIVAGIVRVGLPRLER